jgi:hypothetical protein
MRAEIVLHDQWDAIFRVQGSVIRYPAPARVMPNGWNWT